MPKGTIGRPLQPGHPHRWKPGQSGNPSGKMPMVEAARRTVREFFMTGQGMEGWLALTKCRNLHVRAVVYRDLARFAFGWAPVEINVQRHTSTVNLHLAGIADPGKYTALEEARARVQALLLDTTATAVPQPDEEKGDRDGQGHDADGGTATSGDHRRDET